MLGTIGPLFLAVHKCTQPFETRTLAEIQQFLELFLSLARMSHYHSGTQGHARNLFTKSRYEFSGPRPIHVTTHIRENHVAYVLKRDVEIFADLRVMCHLFKHVFRKVVGIGIMNPYPVNLLYRREFFDKFGKRPSAIEVEPVIGGILRYQNKFLHALRGQYLRLLHQFLHRDGLMRTPNMRNGTVRAPSVTPFGYLKIGSGRAAIRRLPVFH